MADLTLNVTASAANGSVSHIGVKYEPALIPYDIGHLRSMHQDLH